MGCSMHKDKKIIIFVNYICILQQTYIPVEIYISLISKFHRKNGPISLGIGITSTYPFPTLDVSKQKDIGLHD